MNETQCEFGSKSDTAEQCKEPATTRIGGVKLCKEHGDCKPKLVKEESSATAMSETTEDDQQSDAATCSTYRGGLFPGQVVNYHSRIGGEITSSGHKIEKLERMCSGEWVAWISGKGSVVSVDTLSEDS